MFFQLFKTKISLYFFGVGSLIAFIVTIARGLGFFRALSGSLFGGLSALVLWGVIIQVLMTLISERELASIFHLKYSEKNSEYRIDIHDTDDESEDLNFTDLYSESSDNENFLSLDNAEQGEYSDEEDEDQDALLTKSDTSAIGSDGKFDITVNGKTLRASPKDGAEASRRMLFDEANK